MAFNTGGHIVRDNLLVMVDAANPKSYPDPTGNNWHNLIDGRVRNFINYNGVGVSGSDATQRIVFDGSDDIAQYVGTPAGLQGNSNFTVFAAVYRTQTYDNGSIWGIGGDTLNQGFGTYNFANNEISMDFWGRNTFHATGVIYPLNQWVLIHWQYSGLEFTTSTCHIWVNDIEYTDGDLTTDRFAESITPAVNASGMVLGRAGYTTNNYYAYCDIGFWAIYDRALSAAEVLQNFQAKRARYGI